MTNPRTKALGPGQLQEAAVLLGDYATWVENDITLEHILTPTFWRNQAQFFERRKGARITLLSRDLELEVVVRVIHAEEGLVKVRVISKTVPKERLKKPTEEEIEAARVGFVADRDLIDPEGYKTGHAGNNSARPRPGWWVQMTGIVRDGPPTFLKEGLPSRAAAISFAADHKKRAESPVDPA